MYLENCGVVLLFVGRLSKTSLPVVNILKSISSIHRCNRQLFEMWLRREEVPFENCILSFRPLLFWSEFKMLSLQIYRLI